LDLSVDGIHAKARTKLHVWNLLSLSSFILVIS